MSKEYEIAESLHPLERKIIPFLENNKDMVSLQQSSNLKEIEIMRALQWLSNKDAIKLKIQTKAIISLDKNGIKYKEKGLPEINFLKILEKPLTLKEIKEKANLDQDELTISIGILKKKSLIDLKKEVSITEQGKNYLKKQSLEEKFLNSLPKTTSDLTDEDRYAYQELSSRKQIIKTDLKKVVTFELTNLGEKLTKIKITGTYIESLTPQIIKSELWKKTKFRHYEINSIVPRIQQGKKHPVSQVIEYVRRIWLDMGFQEMEGPLLQTSFWNFDALFTPQDHPVRELHDTLFVKAKGNLPDQSIVQKVKETHENGWTTGSKGWCYAWSPEEAKKLVLRTHTTVLSALTLSKIKKQDLPLKFFAVGKCFRNETLDWSHLFEFNQTEGIVVDRNANFKHLLGYLKEFAKKMGFEKVRFRPAYFPYTEPSLEGDVYDPIHKKWIEIIAAGIFRPEVVKPLLGEDIPVLAWGPGLDRMISSQYELKDIRDLYKNDIKQLRSFKTFIN